MRFEFLHTSCGTDFPHSANKKLKCFINLMSFALCVYKIIIQNLSTLQKFAERLTTEKLFSCNLQLGTHAVVQSSSICLAQCQFISRCAVKSSLQRAKGLSIIIDYRKQRKILHIFLVL